jgi:hypothetical protein
MSTITAARVTMAVRQVVDVLFVAAAGSIRVLLFVANEGCGPHC